MRQDRNFLEPYFESAHHSVSVFQPPLPFSKSVSSLVVNKKENDLSCDGEETISIQYNFVGETAGNVAVIYLVSSDWGALKTFTQNSKKNAPQHKC